MNKSNIPSREWLLGWLDGYAWERSCIMDNYNPFTLKRRSRESLYKIYLKIKGGDND